MIYFLLLSLYLFVLSQSSLGIWSVFFFLSVFFLYLINIEIVPSRVSYSYYTIQEMLGFLFLLSFFSYLSCLILLSKLGVSPFHFWVFYILDYFNNYSFIWFFIYNKLFYFPFVFYFLDYLWITLIFGLFVLQVQYLVVYDSKGILVLNSSESFTLLLFFSLFTYFGGVFFILFYIISLFFFFGFSTNYFIDFQFVLFLVSYPLWVGFYLNLSVIFYLIYLLSGFFSFLLILFFTLSLLGVSVSLVLSSLLGYWGLVTSNHFFSPAVFFFCILFFLISVSSLNSTTVSGTVSQ